jgi:hypothetical protein
MHPTFQDFTAMIRDPRNAFPYNLIVYSGNNSDVVAKVAMPRGFLRVFFIYF